MEIIKYEKDEEVPEIIAQKEAEGLVFVEIQNIREGNFLGFVSKDQAQIIIPDETILQKAQKQIMELEGRTKLLEYNTQNMGETLDVHEGAIVDVMTLALGGTPEDL